jgi:hypothetical protein
MSIGIVPADFSENMKLDQRFFWNHHMLKPFLNGQVESFCLAIMQGFVHIEPWQIEEHEFDFVLISRRSCLRSGKFHCYERFWVSRADNDHDILMEMSS